MRILHLTISYPPPLTGGLPRQVQGLTQALSQAGHDIAIATLGPDRQDGTVRVYGADPFHTQLPKRDLPPLASANLGLAKAIVTAARETPWDILHVHDWMLAPTALLGRSMLDIPVVATFHTDSGSLQVGSAADRARRLEWESSLVAEMSAGIACSAHVLEILRERYPNASFTHIPNGIARVDEHRERRKDDGGAKRLLFVGRLVPYKGCQDLIHAFGRLYDTWPNLSLDIVGDGFYRDELELLVDHLKVADRVRFRGWMEGDNLAQIYRQADVLVAPSYEEAFGLTVVEAMSAGTTVIASRIGAFLELVEDNRSGLLARDHDPGDLADQISRVLENSNFASQLAERARRDVLPRYAWTALVPQTEAFYNAALTP